MRRPLLEDPETLIVTGRMWTVYVCHEIGVLGANSRVVIAILRVEM